MNQWFNLNFVLEKEKDGNVDQGKSDKDNQRKGVEKGNDHHPGNHSVEEQRNEDTNCNKSICFFSNGFDSPARSKENGNYRKDG